FTANSPRTLSPESSNGFVDDRGLRRNRPTPEAQAQGRRKGRRTSRRTSTVPRNKLSRFAQRPLSAFFLAGPEVPSELIVRVAIPSAGRYDDCVLVPQPLIGICRAWRR